VAERFERRIVDEICKMFNDSESFYFSLTGDITNSVQRQATTKDANQGPTHPMCHFLFYIKKSSL
jgi:hypothetical protein